MRPASITRRAARLAPVLLLACAACSMQRKTPPEVDPATLADESFVHYLADRPVITADEAYRAMLILADGADASSNFAERREKLIQRGIARPQWRLEENNLADRGAVACMVCRICQIKGGVNLRVLGSAGLAERRYANRELVYLQFLPEGADYVPIRGGEMVSLLTKADAYMAEHKLYESKPIELGDEAEARRLAETTTAEPASHPAEPATQPVEPE